MDQPTAATKPFRLEVAPDKVSVKLHVDAGAKLTSAEVLAALAALNVKKFDDAKIVAGLEARGTDAACFDVAAGTPPVDQRYGKLEYRVPVNQGGGVSITRVEAGLLVAKFGPSSGGTPGIDVFGEAIEPKPSNPPFVAGKGITIAKGEVIAGLKGSLRLSAGTLSVEPLLELPGDGNAAVQFDGDVSIKGGVRDGRVIQVTGSLFVGGVVEAADVKVEGSIQVKGGLIGNGRGRCSTKGDLWCRFIAGGNVSAMGDVNVQGDVTQAQIMCGKTLNVIGGRIYGGRIIANGGVVCATLGNDQSAATVIEVGTDVMLAALSSEITAEMETHRRRARDVREKIEPLMKQLKRLTHQQREKATELLAEAGEAEDRANELAKQLEKQTAELRVNERIEVSIQDVAYAGVTVRIGNLETQLKTAFKGPFKLTTAKVGQVTSIVLIDGGSGKPTPLPSYAATVRNPAATPARKAA